MADDPQVPDFMREFDDAKAARRNIYSNTLEAMKKRFPMEDDNYRLELNDLEYDGPQEYSLAEQKKALLNNRNLRTNLVGTWRLVDKKTGNVLDERRQSVMQVPYWTDRGTIINNGSEYTVISQSRLRPGVYARRKSNGEFEAQFNIRPGTGRAFHIGLQPETGMMTLQTGQGSVPLYQILKGLGVDDKQIVKYWGADVALANSQKVDSQAWNKLYRRMAGYKAIPNATEADKIQFIKDAVSKYEVDPEVVERTMGLRNVSTVTPELLLRASQKVLNVSRGDEKPDNRDNPRFSKFYGVEDYFKERVEKNAGRLANTLLWKAKRNGNLKGIQRNALNPWVDTIINGSGLAMPGEEANPLSTLEQMSRISKFGLGGIGSKDAVTDEARNVQGDYLGFVDFVAGPESEAIGVDTRASYRSFLGRDNKIYGEFIDNQTGKKAYVDIATAADRMVAFPGQDPKSPYLIAIKDGVPQRVPRDEVRYTVPSYGHMVGSNTNMNPMPTGVQVGRQFYGSKFWSQYLPQAKGEVPLVDTLMPDGKLTWREYYGRKVGSIGAEADGVVTKVTDDEITIKGNDGKVYKQELVKNLPFNRLSALSYLPAVEVGQAVKAGDMVAHSNFTDKKTGSINMGQNLYVAVLPDGRSFEDGWSISESAAKRLATDRLYSFDHETRNGVTIGKNKYISAFPSKFTKEQVETLDENGVVKVGTTLHRGDPLVLSLGPKILSSQDKALGKLSKALRNSYVDRSETWEHDYPGKVVDTAVTSKGAKVNVSAQPPVREGDKISPMAGIKGVVAEVIPDDKMPRNAATNQPYDVLMNPMGFLSRVAPNQLIELSLGKVAKATGKQIRIPQLPPPEGWYRWTKAQMDAAGVKDASDVFDPVSGRVIKNIGDGYMYTMAFHHLAEKKASAVGTDGSYTQDEQPAKGGFEGAKKVSGMDLWGMLAHNVPEVIKDAQIIRGTCFDASTEVLTRNGWKNWDRVTADDELFTKEKFGDGQAWYEKPLQLVRYQYDGDLYGYENKHLDWLVTPDHNLWGINCLVSKKKSYRRYRLFKAANIFGKEGVIDAFGQVYAGSIPSSHVLEFTRESIGANRAVKDVRISLFDYCSFMGWWLSEGFANFDGGRGNIYISQDAYVHPAEFNEIRDLGRRMGLGDGVCLKRGKSSSSSFKFTSPVGTYDKIRWRSKPLAQHLLQFGNSAWTKRIPDIIFEAPLDCRLEFLRTYILGDGCERVAKSTGKNPGGCVNWYIGTTSPTLAEDLQRLALISGFSAWYGIDKRAGEYNYKHDYYGVRICKGYTELTIRKHPALQFKGHYTQSYCGPVFCATMSTGLLYVRRNGKCMWSGNCNSDYWRALQLGLPIPEPEEPFIYKKFLNTLRAGGINVTEKGAITKIMPQTDKDIDQLAQGRVITSSDMVDPDFEPMKGGLFDLGKTGGMGGNQWSMIQLPEPVPNPIMEEPVRRVLGLTVAKMEDILAGREKLNGKTGGQALKDALAAVNVDQKLAEAKKGITSLRGQKRDDAVKIYRYLSAMKEQGLKPQDWMVSKVPVLPPAFRPVSKMGDVALVSDMNELYKDILENAKNFEELRKDVSDDGLADERLDIYNSVKAAYGLGEPITPENAAKGVKGAIKQVIGSRPKFGMFQSKVTSKAVNGVARGVTVADPNYDMDEIGMPEDMAWPVYKPYVMRALVRNGYPTVAAIKMIADRTPTARHLLEEEMSKRPVIMDRAPTWHKFNFMAFKPRLVDGHKIVVSPLVDPAYNMDHDGNCVDFDSLVVVRLAKSMLDKMEEICDNGVSQNQKEYSMTNANTSVRIVNHNKVEAVVKIGTFPRVGTPTLDKNGAYIYEVPEGIEVLSTDPVTGERRFEPVTKFTHEYDCETVKVSYGSKSVIVSGNESLAVFDQKEGRLVRVKPDEAEKRFTPVFVSSSDRFGSFGDRDLGWLFGSYISDGWSDYRMVGYTKVEKIKRDEFVRILRDNHQNFNLYEYTDSKGDKKLGNSVKIHCNSQSVSRWLNQWQFIHEDRDEANGARTALYKMIDPRLIESGSEEFLWGLMSGLLDGDGSIVCNTAKTKPRYTFRLNTSSPYLRDGLCRLCHKLGLRYSVTVVPARGWSKESYVVSPSTVDMFTKLDRLTCIGESEKKVLAALKAVQKRPTDNADMVPVSDVEFDSIKTCPLLVSGGSLYNTLHRTAKEGARRAGREHLKGILSYLQEHDETKALVARVLATNTKWVQITSVEPAGKREVFDLEVATTKTFVVNDGITVWDTVNLHVPSSYKAVQQALEKMLPSENLTSLTDLSSPRYTPGKEQIFGLYALTKGMDMSKSVKVFNSVSEAKQAYARGEIGPNDPIEIRG